MKRKQLVWENRDRDLASVKRFFDPKRRFEVMYYRTNLLVHTRRIEEIGKTLIPIAQEYFENFDPVLFLLICRHHDDLELVSKHGDMSSYRKMQMNRQQLQLFEKEEYEDVNIIASYYPPMIEGYSYKDILLHAMRKDIPEAQLCSYIDKHDGFCESLHEVLAGNSIFLEPLLNYAFHVFSKNEEKFPLLHHMLSCKDYHHPLLGFPIFDLMQFFKNGQLKGVPHTKSSIKKMTEIPVYDFWKDITVHNLESGMRLLTYQQERQAA